MLRLEAEDQTDPPFAEFTFFGQQELITETTAAAHPKGFAT